MNCIKKLPWSAGKYIDTRKYYPQDRVYCDGSVYASLAEQVGNKPYFKQDSDGTYTVAPGWALLAAGLLEDNGLGYDYEVLENLPSVNGVVLKGDKTPEELGMYSKEGADEKFETKFHAADTFQTKESAAEADKRVQGMLDGKVDKEPGKGLSANDLTDERAGKVDKLVTDGRANEYLNGAGTYSRPVRQGYGVSVADDNTVSVDPQVIARQSDVASVAADLAAQKAKEQGDIDRANAAISKEETDRKAAVAALKTLTAGHTKSIEDLRIAKQDALVSGTNIKTINNQSLVGSGNISIEGGGTITVDDALSDTSENPVQNKVITTKVNSLETSLGSKANASDIPTKVSQLENDSTYQTKANLDTALESYAKTSDVNSKNASQDEAIQGKQDKLVSGTNIKTINGVPVLGSGDIKTPAPTKVSELENDKGFLTEHQSLDDYAKTAEVTEMINQAVVAAINTEI